MRILHTADWHLGRALEGRSRLDEQAQFIDELCEMVADTDARIIIISGDVFDSANPPAAAEELFYDAVSRLGAGGRCAVLVLAGNHDSPERLCAAAPLATRQGVVLFGRPGEAPQGSGARTEVYACSVNPGWTEVKSGSETAQIAVLPYPSEARLDSILSDSIANEADLRRAYSDRVAQAFAPAASRYSSGAIRIAASHLYAAGGIESDSERPIQVGGAFTVHSGAFPAAAQYVALGHLHRPQNLASEVGAIRYSGSPLAYSFAETGQAKSVTLLEASPEQITWRELHISAGKPLVRWKAPYGISQVEQWCSAGRDANAWVELEISLETPLTPEELAKLKRLHRGLVIIRPVFSAQQQVAAIAEDRQSLPMEELFRLFYLSRKGGAEPAPETVRLFLSLLADAAGEQSGPEDASGGSFAFLQS